jgi:predicted dehydrogenase
LREDKQPTTSRRQFITSAASATFAFTVAQRYARGESPNERLNVACIGCGGKGESDVGGVSNQTVVALCDVDEDRAAKSFERHPDAKRYSDWRVMLDKEADNIDAVTVSTPDHTHAPASMAAIQLSKHVYVQKPMTHSVFEAQKLMEAAREKKVATQMGNQGHASEDTRRICEWLWQGAVGTVKEVHFWTNRPIWPQGLLERPKDTPAAPEKLNWDVWLGPAPERAYHPCYHPFAWRGWWDFGCGAIGDMACHIMDAGVWAMKLTGPCTVEALATHFNTEGFPKRSISRYEFPARGDLPPVKAYWYDGGEIPPLPLALEEWARENQDENKRNKLPTGDNGQMYVGDKGVLVAGTYGEGPRLFPEPWGKEFLATNPKQMIPRSPGHYEEWIRACKGGEPNSGNFDHAGPLTITALLGNVAMRAGEKINWDGQKVTNVGKANEYLQREYRKGWTL